MAEKVTIMVLKVDLQCSSCYKKIKKVLLKFPQIKVQIYDEKQNTVTITVLCCSPEKIRDKLYYKGEKTIKSIEIKEPQKPKPVAKPPAPKEAPKTDPQKNPGPAKPTAPKEAAKADPQKKPESAQLQAPKDAVKVDPPKKQPAPKAQEPESVMMPGTVYGYPYPVGVRSGPYYEGYIGGPFYHGYGRPIPPLLQPRPCYDGYGYGRCDYFSDENASRCIII